MVDRDEYVVDEIMRFMEASGWRVVRLDAEEMYDRIIEAGMVPHRVSDEGTGYCPLAERAGREVERLRDGIRARHRPQCDDIPANDLPWCVECIGEWPCPTVRLLAGDNI